MNDSEIEAAVAEIQAARQNLGMALRDLQEAFNPFDWRQWVARHPVQSAVGAAAVGFMLAQPGGNKRNGVTGSFLGALLRGSLGAVVPHLLRLFL